jgi:S1-C subfamily serine protease
VYCKQSWISALIAAAVISPASAVAQDRPDRVRVESPRSFSFAFNRGRIGVVVQTDDNREADQVGARIEAVSPGGPSEKAGLKAGDVITRFNGVSLAKTSDEESNPGTKLVRLAQALDPGDTVRIEYRRGNENRHTTLVAEDVDVQWSMEGSPGMRGRLMLPPDFLDLPDDLPELSYMFRHPWGRLEMVNLNPDLGEYFGTAEGVLVVRAPEEQSLPFKGGDVILSIAGRKPTSPAHAMRILRSYESGESVKIEVLRKQKRSTLTWTVPERESRRERSVRRRPSESET